MVTRREKLAWAVLALMLIALAVPWFLWRSDTVIVGLPVWLWWHIGWIALTALVFKAFTDRAWGIGIEEGV